MTYIFTEEKQEGSSDESDIDFAPYSKDDPDLAETLGKAKGASKLLGKRKKAEKDKKKKKEKKEKKKAIETLKHQAIL